MLVTSANRKEASRHQDRVPFLARLHKPKHSASNTAFSLQYAYSFFSPTGLLTLSGGSSPNIQPSPTRSQQGQRKGKTVDPALMPNPRWLWDTIPMTDAQLDNLEAVVANCYSDSLSSSSTSTVSQSRSTSAAPSSRSHQRSATLAWPSRKSFPGVALPFGQQPAKLRTDAELIQLRLSQSQKIRITGDAAACSTLKEFAGYRCVAFRLNMNPDNNSWIWHEILDAPVLSMEPLAKTAINSEVPTFRTQVLYSRRRTDVSKQPDYGQFDICFQQTARIEGAFLQFEGQQLFNHKYRRIDKLALLEVPKVYSRHDQIQTFIAELCTAA